MLQKNPTLGSVNALSLLVELYKDNSLVQQIQQVVYVPQCFGNSGFHCRGYTGCGMNANEIVVHEMQDNHVGMILNFL